MSRTEINMMYFMPSGYWNEKEVDRSLLEMKDHGVDSVCIPFIEHPSSWDGAESYAGKIMDTGLRCYLMPGRIAGIFAAGPCPSSSFVLKHPEVVIQDRDGKPFSPGNPCACVNQPAFQEWFIPFMESILTRTGAQGLFYDEPKRTETPCYCSVCRELAGDNPQALMAMRERSFAEVLGKTSAMVKGIDPTHTTLAMIMPFMTENFVQALCAQDALDVIGVDGPICTQKVKKESLFTSAPRINGQVKDQGKKTFTLAETFEVPASSQEELLTAMERLPEVRADVMSFNYYGHANDNPEEVMQAVWKGIETVKG
ncbi:MAG: hypothetical protein ACYTGH_16065 [Planctomycetota bacterium]|jgi:hypothetical protein